MNDDSKDNVTTPLDRLGQTRHGRGAMVWVIGGLVVLLLVGLFVVPFFYGLPARPYAYYPTPFFFFPFGFLIFFFIVFFAARLLFWGSSWGWGWPRGYARGYWRQGYYGDAREILRQRYARGEIAKDQFDQMMSDLKAHEP